MAVSLEQAARPFTFSLSRTAPRSLRRAVHAWRRTQSRTWCRETWWTGHCLFGSVLDPVPRPVTPVVAALICDTDIDWTSDC